MYSWFRYLPTGSRVTGSSPVTSTTSKAPEEIRVLLFCPNCFITILTGKMDGMMQRLPQRRELSPKVTEGVAVLFLFHTKVSVDTAELLFQLPPSSSFGRIHLPPRGRLCRNDFIAISNNKTDGSIQTSYPDEII